MTLYSSLGGHCHFSDVLRLVLLNDFYKIRLLNFFITFCFRLTKMCCAYVLIYTTMPVDSWRSADNIKRIVPPPH